MKEFRNNSPKGKEFWEAVEKAAKRTPEWIRPQIKKFAEKMAEEASEGFEQRMQEEKKKEKEIFRKDISDILLGELVKYQPHTVPRKVVTNLIEELHSNNHIDDLTPFSKAR